MDGEKLDIRFLVLWHLYARNFRGTKFHAKSTEVSFLYPLIIFLLFMSVYLRSFQVTNPLYTLKFTGPKKFYQ